VQIFDYEGKPLAKTDNLGEKNLPTLPTKQILYKHSPEDLVRLYNDSCTGEIFYSVDVLGTEDECFLKRKCKLNGKDVFYYFKRTKSMLITIAAPEIYFSRPVDDYYSEMLGFLPVVFIVILISGILFIRYALRPINRITAAANKITINNMHERLPELKAKDELSRLTETLNAMLDRLEVSFNEVKRFTSDASHELKTPLTILRGELELALNADEEKQDFIMTIASSLDEVIRLTNVVESLLELSRADLGRVKLNLAKKSLSRLIADIAEDAAILAEEKDLSVYAKIEPDVNFIFDPVRIHQAVINITDNAIKYNKKNGSINIGMWTVDDNVYIRISDTGYGMQEDKLEHIFDRFYRVEESRTEQGAGLGLSIVKWIVDAHEGKITVHSKFNEGTEFEIRLPMNNERLNIMYLEDRAAQERADKERADFAERQKEAKRAEKKDNEEEA
jgi:signal transduction histidine kinase